MTAPTIPLVQAEPRLSITVTIPTPGMVMVGVNSSAAITSFFMTPETALRLSSVIAGVASAAMAKGVA